MTKGNRLIRAFVAFWSTLRGKNAKRGTLREFVYLDETSVESLLASLDGEILTGIVESRSRGTELAIAATGDAIGVPVGVGPSARRTRSIVVEEQRKSVAQSAFARLRSRHFASLRLRVPDALEGAPVLAELDKNRDLPTSSLRRGDLIEVDAILGGSDVFQVKTVINSMIGVVDAFPEQLNTPDLAPIRDAEPIVAILDSLSQGLIPIEGEVVGFRAVTVDGIEWIVAAEVAAALSKSGFVSAPIRIAGVSLEPLYWQDVRRVLFSDLKFRVMGRLIHDGTRTRWSSVKLSDVLSRVNTGLGETVDKLGASFLTSLQAGANRTSASVDSAITAARIDSIKAFAHACMAAVALPWIDEDTAIVDRHIAETELESLSLESWRDLLRNLGRDLLARSEDSLEATVLVELRTAHPLPISEVTTAPSTPLYLELELIAIYW